MTVKKVDFIKKSHLQRRFLAIVSLGRDFGIFPKLFLNSSGVGLSRYIGPKIRHLFLKFFRFQPPCTSQYQNAKSSDLPCALRSYKIKNACNHKYEIDQDHYLTLNPIDSILVIGSRHLPELTRSKYVKHIYF